MLSLVQLSLLYVDHILFHCYSNSFALLYMCMGGGDDTMSREVSPFFIELISLYCYFNIPPSHSL